jgi:hypothetical protein
VYEADVAPLILVNVVAPGALEDHCTLDAAQFAGVEPAALNVAAAAAVTVSFDGWVVIAGDAAHAGGALTVSVASRVFVEPWALVNVASYLVPLCAVMVAGVVYEADVAPLILVNVVAPGALEDHCTLDAAQFAGVEPAALNVAAAAAVTVSFDGWVVIAGDAAHAGGALTVSVAPRVFVDPCSFVNSARYSLPADRLGKAMSSVGLVVSRSVVSFDHVRPPSVETCHWTVSVWQLGSPFDPAAVNVAT